ncbi:hypothetical protein [Paraburkholderia tropica]|uniref:hypothetical protein n=1 Tax=Paraburkholderia tropica TaxID=92647 RepID=UPI001CC742DF|nr:hypothetical protein [Paraburkholderia tropica]
MESVHAATETKSSTYGRVRQKQALCTRKYSQIHLASMKVSRLVLPTGFADQPTEFADLPTIRALGDSRHKRRIDLHEIAAREGSSHPVHASPAEKHAINKNVACTFFPRAATNLHRESPFADVLQSA